MVEILLVVTQIVLVIVYIFLFRELKELRSNYEIIKRACDLGRGDFRLIHQRLLEIEDKMEPQPEPQLTAAEEKQIEHNQKLMQALIDEYLG